MPAITPYYMDGVRTYTVTEQVAAGQFVEARSGGVIGVAAAGSQVVLGVALTDALPNDGSSTNAFGVPVVNAALYPPQVAVAGTPATVPLTYGAAATFGARLKVGTAGQPIPWVFGTDNPELIVGYCAEPGGVASGASGRVRLTGC